MMDKLPFWVNPLPKGPKCPKPKMWISQAHNWSSRRPNSIIWSQRRFETKSQIWTTKRSAWWFQRFQRFQPSTNPNWWICYSQDSQLSPDNIRSFETTHLKQIKVGQQAENLLPRFCVPRMRPKLLNDISFLAHSIEAHLAWNETFETKLSLYISLYVSSFWPELRKDQATNPHQVLEVHIRTTCVQDQIRLSLNYNHLPMICCGEPVDLKYWPELLWRPVVHVQGNNSKCPSIDFVQFLRIIQMSCISCINMGQGQNITKTQLNGPFVPGHYTHFGSLDRSLDPSRGRTGQA